MKVISIIQPWAMLIAIGEKKFETRSWATKYRGELAIHSSKKIDKHACKYEPIRSILAQHGYTVDNLPTGVILAKSKLADCIKVTVNNGDSAILGDGKYIVEDKEYLFGNYNEGRFAWELNDVEMLKKFIPAKGQLGLWNTKE
jgi:hypothetical protein